LTQGVSELTYTKSKPL